MDDMSATGDEICERFTGRPLRVLAARPMCKLKGCSLSRLVVNARARDMVVDILVWPLMEDVFAVDVQSSAGSQERSFEPLQEARAVFE